jgi:hypothetical protein
MRGVGNVGPSDERYRAAAAFLLSMPLYAALFSVPWIVFGFWKAAVLMALFLVVRGHRVVSTLTARWVRDLPTSRSAPDLRRGRAKDSAQKVLVIDHDPNEFKRSYR